jgi:hypothetical protein
MKTQLILFNLLASVFTTQIQAQNRTIINATNSEISDNLDLKAVASIFGESNNLQDFERRLNDPNLPISNLDLNNDNQVDYLRVIETMENQTHVIIIQDVLARNTYQDVATIIVEKDNYNAVNVQIVGDSYLYGQNYIYEPIYYKTPSIYSVFWNSNYRPYYSAWNWNIYPSYYYTWNPYPVFRYRNNMRHSINSYNQYNYGAYRRSSIAISLYSNSRRSNGYERQHPDYSFSRRNSDINNRFELDQRRNKRNEYQSTSALQRTVNNREFSQNKNISPRVNAQTRTRYQGNNSQNRNDFLRRNTQQSQQQSTQPQRNNTQNKSDSPRVNTQQNVETQRIYSPNRNNIPRANTPQNTESRREYSQNKSDSPRANIQQNTQSKQNYQNKTAPQTTNIPKRIQTIKNNSQSTTTTKDNSSDRNENRRR